MHLEDGGALACSMPWELSSKCCHLKPAHQPVTKWGTTPFISGTNPVKPCLKLIFMDLSCDMSLPHPAVPFSWSASAFFSSTNITSLENDRWSYTLRKKGQSFDHRDESTLLTEQNGPWKILFFSSAEVLIYLSLSLSSQVDLNSFIEVQYAGFGWDRVNYLESS